MAINPKYVWKPGDTDSDGGKSKEKSGGLLSDSGLVRRLRQNRRTLGRGLRQFASKLNVRDSVQPEPNLKSGEIVESDPLLSQTAEAQSSDPPPIADPELPGESLSEEESLISPEDPALSVADTIEQPSTIDSVSISDESADIETKPEMATLQDSEMSAAQEPEKASFAIRRFRQDVSKTVFIARALALEGRSAQALQIYDELVKSNPDDEKLQLEASKLQEGRIVSDPLMARVSFLDDTCKVEKWDEKTVITCHNASEKNLSVSWHVTSEGMKRAQESLGQSGELALRIYEIFSDSQREVHTDVIEHGPVEDEGNFTFADLTPGSQRLAAIGLRADDEFRAITHTHINEQIAE